MNAPRDNAWGGAAKKPETKKGLMEIQVGKVEGGGGGEEV